MDILKLNSISKLANPVLEGYNLTDNSQNPVGILVRSFKMDEYEVPSSVGGCKSGRRRKQYSACGIR